VQPTTSFCFYKLPKLECYKDNNQGTIEARIVVNFCFIFRGFKFNVWIFFFRAE